MCVTQVFAGFWMVFAFFRGWSIPGASQVTGRQARLKGQHVATQATWRLLHEALQDPEAAEPTGRA